MVTAGIVVAGMVTAGIVIAGIVIAGMVTAGIVEPDQQTRCAAAVGATTRVDNAITRRIDQLRPLIRREWCPGLLVVQ
jgi:hypothetical protein